MIRALIVLGLCGSVAYAQPVVPSWRPPSGCTSGQAIVFNGSIWTCGSAGVTNSAGANVIPKSDGTNLVASSWTDNGTTTTATTNLSILGAASVSGNATIGGPAGFGVSVDANVGLKVAKPIAGTYGLVVSTGQTSLSQDGSTTTAHGALVVNGSATLGDSDSADSHTIRGAVTQTANATIGYTLTNTRSALASDSNGLQVTQTGTYDAIAADRTARGLLISATGSRSAGGNNVINHGIEVTASGGQINRAIYTAAGDVVLNASTGNTCIGATSCSDKLSVTGTTSISGNTAIGGTLGVTGASTLTGGFTAGAASIIRDGTPTTALAPPTGTVLAVEQADATDLHLNLRGTGNKYLSFGNGSNATDGYIWYSTSRNLLFGTLNSVRMVIGANTGISIGDSGGSTIGNNVDVLVIGNTGTGQTASTSLINATHTGSFSTAGGNVTYYGGNIAVSATESAGTGTLTAVALRLSATNGDDPIGLLVDDGRVQFDGDFTVGGNTTLGNANTDTLTITSKINSKVYYTGTAGTVLCQAGGGGSAAGTVTGSDTRGVITPPTGSYGSCTLTFNSAWSTNPPVCVANATAGSVTVTSISTTAVTFSFSSDLGDTSSVYYHCDGRL